VSGDPGAIDAGHRERDRLDAAALLPRLPLGETDVRGLRIDERDPGSDALGEPRALTGCVSAGNRSLVRRDVRELEPAGDVTGGEDVADAGPAAPIDANIAPLELDAELGQAETGNGGASAVATRSASSRARRASSRSGRRSIGTPEDTRGARRRRTGGLRRRLWGLPKLLGRSDNGAPA